MWWGDAGRGGEGRGGRDERSSINSSRRTDGGRLQRLHCITRTYKTGEGRKLMSAVIPYIAPYLYIYLYMCMYTTTYYLPLITCQRHYATSAPTRAAPPRTPPLPPAVLSAHLPAIWRLPHLTEVKNVMSIKLFFKNVFLVC